MRDRFLWLGCLLYAVLFAALGWAKYAVHRNLVDFGIFSQTAASAFGCFCNPIEGSHWAFHFSPILYPVGIVLALAHSPLTLIVLAAVAGALVAPPIYGLVLRERGDVGAARLAAVVAWLYPPLAGLIFGDFHENSFAPAAVAWTLYAFDADLTAGTIVFALATLAIKEDQGAFLAIAGALGAWYYRGTTRGKVAAAVAAISVAVLVAFFAFIQPHASADAAFQWRPQRFYAWSGEGAILPELAARLGFLLLIFVPLLFLPLRTRMIWLAAAPLAEVLLSRMSTTFTLGTHYAGAWIGYVLVAFAFTLRRLDPGRIRLASIACVVLCLIEFAVADPLHPGMNLRAVQPRDVALDQFLQTLPNEVSIATQEEAYTHLALTDPYARLLPEVPQIDTNACFVLIDRDFPESARLREYNDAFTRLLLDARYTEVAVVGGIELYRRTGPCE
ncbi:MAG TPA: DUF2079 domain-containing protein [Candidatus Binatia bacterium]|nr:DUF2079 domain-containing protein [Candidatus Binatia bacterium]